MKINFESIFMILFVVFIIAVHTFYYFVMPVCGRLTKDLTSQQLQECMKK